MLVIDNNNKKNPANYLFVCNATHVLSESTFTHVATVPYSHSLPHKLIIDWHFVQNKNPVLLQDAITTPLGRFTG